MKILKLFKPTGQLLEQLKKFYAKYLFVAELLHC